MRFTENQPDVVAVRENIAQLERRLREAAAQIREGGAVSRRANNPVRQAPQISRHETETEIASLQAE
ncbi:MAG: hypothetical protein RIB46_05065 [Pseudomonadales bacterium]